MRLAGKTAWITGGASGIGRATALRFAREGASVLITDLNRAAGEEVTEEIRRAGGRAQSLRCDVTVEEEVAAAAAFAQSEFGGLDVLVTAAGVLLGAYQEIAELDAALFRRVLEVNVVGTFLCCKHAAPLLAQSPGGVVLCLASAAGVRGPSSSLPYGASKAGVYGFCQTLERQLAPHGVRVHVLCPSRVDTPMKRQNLVDTAAHRGEALDAVLAEQTLTHPDEIASVLLFLASPEGAGVQGTVFTK